MVEVPGGVAVTVGEEGDSIVGGESAAENASQQNDDDCQKGTTIAFRHLTVTVGVDSSMHHSGPKTHQ